MAPSAYAATHTVDDDKADCPAATFTSIQAAVDAAATGDTITVCAGDYAEGTGAPGTNAVTITKSLTLKGAGADLVTISPKANPLVRGSIIEEGISDIRNGVGDIVAIVGTPTKPLDGQHLGRHGRRLRPAGPRGRGRGGRPVPRRQGLDHPHAA